MSDINFFSFFSSLVCLYFSVHDVQTNFGLPYWPGNIPPVPYNPYITWPLSFFNRPQYFPNPPIYASNASIIGIFRYDDYKWNNFYDWTTTTEPTFNHTRTGDLDPDSYQQFVQSSFGYYAGGTASSPSPSGSAMPTTSPATIRPTTTFAHATTFSPTSGGLSVGLPPPPNVVKDFNASEHTANNEQCSCYPFCIVEKDCADQQVVSIQVGNNPDGRACFATEGRMPHGSRKGVCVYTDDVRTRCIDDDKEKCLTFHRCCVDPQLAMRNEMAK